MLMNTYKAILHGNWLKWDGPAPKYLPVEEGVPVHVIVLNEATDEPTRVLQGEKMAAALNRLAQMATRTIKDPLAWEREQRQDRILPKRP